MPLDVNLQMVANANPITATGVQGTTLETEGGFLAWVHFLLGVITDSNETFNIDIEASRDGGSNYFPVLTMEQFTNDEESKKISRPVYIPRPNKESSIRTTKVRVNCTAVGGTTPSLPVDIFLDPMQSLAVPANDEDHDAAADRVGAAFLFT